MTPPRVLAAAGVSAGGNPGKDVGASLRGASGTPPLRFARGRAAAGGCPSSGPAGPPSPRGKARAVVGGGGVSAGRRGRRPLRFARGRAAAETALIRPWGHPGPEGKARAVVEVSSSRGVGDSGRPRQGGGTPRPTDGDMETPAGFTWAPVPGPPHGSGPGMPGLRVYPDTRQWFGP